MKKGVLSVLLSALLVLMVGPFLHSGSSIQTLKGITSSKMCKKCHEEIFGEWKNAMHSMSMDDPIFKASYMQAYFGTAGSAKFECLQCHAPFTLMNKDYDLTKDITQEGVSCDFCHSVKEVHPGNKSNPFVFDLGNTKRGPLSNTSSPAHDTEPSSLFKSSELCAGCHEYTNEREVTILGTYSEWKQSPYPGENTQCQNCHMPLIPGRTVREKIKKSAQKQINLHAISAGHSTEQLQKALDVKITKADIVTDFINVEVDVTNVGSGHVVPTGIPTRNLILLVELKTPNEYFVQQRVYQRLLVDEQGNLLSEIYDIFKNAAKVSLDTRLKPRETRTERFVFAVPKNKKITISARVEYLYKAKVLSPTEMRVKMAEDKKIISR